MIDEIVIALHDLLELLHVLRLIPGRFDISLLERL